MESKLLKIGERIFEKVESENVLFSKASSLLPPYPVLCKQNVPDLAYVRIELWIEEIDRTFDVKENECR